MSGAVLGQKVINYRDAGEGACHSAQCHWWGNGSATWVYGFTNLSPEDRPRAPAGTWGASV